MKKRVRSIILNLLGIYFLILGLLAIYGSISRGTPFQLLYACYAGILLIGVGMLTKKGFLILSQVYILAIPLLLWAIDFIHWLIFNSPLWGLTDYFFSGLSTNLDKFVTLQHLYTIPVAIYAAKLIGVKIKHAWIWSFIQVTLMFLVIASFSPSKLNINCVFVSCLNINYGLPYILVWFLASFAMISITALILNYFLWSKKEKIEANKKI